MENFVGNADVVVALTKALDRPDLQIAAARGLAGHGVDATGAVDKLVGMLQSAERRAQSAAIFTLTRIGPPAKSALPALAAMLATANNKYERNSIANAIWTIDPEYAQESKIRRQ